MPGSGPSAIGRRYTLKRQIGRGGMGAVWLALDEVLGREVAVKRLGLFPGASSADLLRAQREAKLAASLNHPHVVSVFDFVTDGEDQWLVMEYVAGTNLHALADQRGLPPGEAAALLGQVAEALAAAHTAGIVHRDVKPSNILVTEDRTAKLADFGIARARADSTLTATGMVAGSPAYLAPEVASGKPATEASDVWSLGATLYHTLAGRPPYDVTDNVLGAMYKIVHEAPPRLPDAGWPAELLETTMTTDPEDRWPMSRVREYLLSAPEHALSGTDEPMPTAVLPVIPAAPIVTTAPVGPAHGGDGAETEPETEAVADDPPEPPEPDDQPDEEGVAAGAENRGNENRGNRWMLPIVLGVGVLLIAALAGWALLTQGPSETADDPGGDAPAAETPSRTSSPRESSPPTKTTPPAKTEAETKGATPPGARGNRVGEMRSFVQDYVATALADPERSWQQLTPRFQQEIGSFASYEGFWNTIERATLREVRADPDAMQVSYVITWDPEGEGGTEDEQVLLGLVRSDGRYLIDYER